MKKTIATAAAATALAVALCPMAGATSLYLSGTQQPGAYVPTSQSEATYFAGPNAIAIQYPHSIFGPLAQGEWLGPSEQAGYNTGLPMVQSGDTVVGVSQGAVVAQQIKHNLPSTITNVTFITYGDPSNTDGGILAKLAGLGISIPGILPTYTADDNTPYNTTTVAKEYEGISDAPDNLLNLLADANAIAGAYYLHPTYTPADLTKPGNIVTTTTNQAGGTNTHILVPTVNLPLTQPLRDMGLNTSGIDKVLRPIINQGYNRPKTKPSVKASKPAKGKSTKGHAK